jgi:hypothetical protein
LRRRGDLRRHDGQLGLARAMSISPLAFFSASSAAALGGVGLLVVQVLAADGGVGQHGDAVGCTSRMPPATKTNSSLPSAISMRTEPGLMRVISGVWRG